MIAVDQVQVNCSLSSLFFSKTKIGVKGVELIGDALQVALAAFGENMSINAQGESFAH